MSSRPFTPSVKKSRSLSQSRLRPMVRTELTTLDSSTSTSVRDGRSGSAVFRAFMLPGTWAGVLRGVRLRYLLRLRFSELLFFLFGLFLHLPPAFLELVFWLAPGCGLVPF